jgi:hypothetical protein
MQTIDNQQLETMTGGAPCYVPVPACHGAPGARPFYGPYPQYAVPRAAWWPQYSAYNAYNAYPGWWGAPAPARRAWWW